ncbi:MFS monocarboxylate transporter [Aspergillus terreus]|uniref:MFS monocarboxylate transporter n=1 Tax=Aspergillus terreus TaxID=33178 RepID=A0A5M3YNG4_ASPTE|nr:hypothetical protein ATETN484_0002015500 [Aspergillus terreus]GFF14938.1 MFS monocarboxylate transporter [Aspergillus terreus]
MTTAPTSTATTRDEMEVEKKPGTVITCTPDNCSPCTSVQTEEKFYEEQPLPPVDRGKEAWLLLAACFVLEAVGWGFPTTFGVFQNHYRNDPAFEGSHDIAVIGTCSTGISYLTCPFVMIGMLLFPRAQRWISTAGVLIMSVALAVGSFSTSITQLILSQGVAYGVGCAVANAPSVFFVPDWFVKRKGLAYGIIWSGSALTGATLPICFETLITHYGWQTSLRVASVAIFIVSIVLLPYHKPRTPSTKATLGQIDLSFQLNHIYIIHQLGNTIQALGFFLPSIFLTSHASAIGANGILASLALTLFNVASIFGCIMQGYLVDHYPVSNCILGVSAGATLSVFLVWGFSTSLAPLYIFAILYGVTAGGFSATWSSVTNEIVDSHKTADIRLVFGLMEAGRGVGNVASGPLSETLLRAGRALEGQAHGAYGSQFGYLVVFTGLTAMYGGIGFFVRLLK